MGIYDKKNKQSAEIRLNDNGEFKLNDGCCIPEMSEETSYFYIAVFPGVSLSNYFNEITKKAVNLISIATLGIKMVKILEMVHATGNVHNDLGLDKIIIG